MASETLTLAEIRIDGTALDDAHGAGLESIRVSQRLSAPAQCELVFREPEIDMATGRFPALSAELRIALRQTGRPLFEGRVSAVECDWSAEGRSVRIRGYDALHALRKRQTLRRFERVDPASLARKVTQPLGLRVEAHADSAPSRELFQLGESDLDLLDQNARRAGLYLALEGETLHLITLAGFGEPLTLHFGKTLYAARLERNGDPACAAVQTYGWDASRATDASGRARAARRPRGDGAPLVPEPLLGELALLDRRAEGSGHAEALAQAERDRRAALACVLVGAADGDPHLAPGRIVSVEGDDGAFGGTHVLTRVDHELNALAGYVSQFSTEPPPAPRPTAAAGAAGGTMGVVVSADDPEELGRVRARLPALGDVETDWAPVLCPAGGKGKGFVSLPEAGDRVLVALLRGDPAQAIVLGGLYGEAGPPDSGVVGGHVRRYSWQTPEGQRLQLDDAAGRIRAEAGEIALESRSGTRLHLEDGGDLVLSAAGHRIVLQAKRIDFEER